MDQHDVLVVGATGATGRLLVSELLGRGARVRAIVRAADRLPDAVRLHDALTVIEAGVAEMGDDELARHLRGCSAAASCLGHTLSVRGVYGRPRRLVADTARRLCAALADDPARGDRPARFVLMNSAGVRHRGQPEPISPAQHTALALLRVLVPPHADNERAAEHLRTGVGTAGDAPVQWSVVRPDTLTDAPAVTAYDLHPAPTRSAIFNAGKTHRINVAHFMADLLTDDALWQQWRGKMPVLYNRGG